MTINERDGCELNPADVFIPEHESCEIFDDGSDGLLALGDEYMRREYGREMSDSQIFGLGETKIIKSENKKPLMSLKLDGLVCDSLHISQSKSKSRSQSKSKRYVNGSHTSKEGRRFTFTNSTLGSVGLRRNVSCQNRRTMKGSMTERERCNRNLFGGQSSSRLSNSSIVGRYFNKVLQRSGRKSIRMPYKGR